MFGGAALLHLARSASPLWPGGARPEALLSCVYPRTGPRPEIRLRGPFERHLDCILLTLTPKKEDGRGFDVNKAVLPPESL